MDLLTGFRGILLPGEQSPWEGCARSTVPAGKLALNGVGISGQVSRAHVGLLSDGPGEGMVRRFVVDLSKLDMAEAEGKATAGRIRVRQEHGDQVGQVQALRVESRSRLLVAGWVEERWAERAREKGEIGPGGAVGLSMGAGGRWRLVCHGEEAIVSGRRVTGPIWVYAPEIVLEVSIVREPGDPGAQGLVWKG